MSKLQYKGHEILVKYDKSLETPVLRIDGKVYTSGPVFNSDKEALDWGKSVVDHIESKKSISSLLESKGIKVNRNKVAKSDLQRVINIIRAGYGDVEGDEPGQKDIDRLKGILEKSKGDPEKAKKLAQNMAKTIKESDKSIRRAKAAKMVFQGKLAEEIYDIFMEAVNHLPRAAASPVNSHYGEHREPTEYHTVKTQQVVAGFEYTMYSSKEDNKLIEDIGEFANETDAEGWCVEHEGLEKVMRRVSKKWRNEALIVSLDNGFEGWIFHPRFKDRLERILKRSKSVKRLSRDI